jgi:hypothetical protein
LEIAKPTPLQMINLSTFPGKIGMRENPDEPLGSGGE